MNAPINISPEEWDLIETWLDQKETPGETPMLSDKLTQIPNISQKIEHVEKVREEIEDSIRQSKIKEFHTHISTDKKPAGIKGMVFKRIKPNLIWYAAAILVISFGIFWMVDHKDNSEKIFAKHFTPDIGLPLRMSTANASGFYEGMLDYKQENYTAAIEKWQILVKTNPENDTLNYFLGVANLALGNSAVSLKYLGNQERFQQGIFKDDAAFYAALANIKEGKFKEAGVLLKSHPSIRNTNLINELNKR